MWPYFKIKLTQSSVKKYATAIFKTLCFYG